MENKKPLVAYFSYSGVTEQMAKAIAEKTDGDLFKIRPLKAYAKSYNECVAQAKREKESNARPALEKDIEQTELQSYDTVFIGYPIWWYDAPMIIYTFLEKNNFSGKTVIPFATSGGSGFCGSEERIEKTAKTTVGIGMLISGSRVDEKQINDWL